MKHLREARLSPNRGLMVLPVAALLVGVFLSGLGFWLVRHWVEGEAFAAREKRVEILHGQLVQRLSLYDQALHATAAFVRLAEPASIGEWGAFVEQLGISAVLAETPALAYAALVRRGEAEDFVAQARRDGVEEFRIWPSADADLLVVNRFSAPMTDSNRAALGYDMYHDPVRRAAMDAARDSGASAITSQVTLTIDNGAAAAMPAFIAYAPVYARDLPTDTVEQRRLALKGFTLAPVRLSTLLAQAFGGVGLDAVVLIHDGEPQDTALLYGGAGGDAVGQWWRRDIAFSNRTWSVLYGFAPTGERSLQTYLPWAVLAFGLVVTGLLAMVLRNVVTVHDNAVRIAGDMTRALRDSEAKFKAVFENSVQFESLLTADGRLVSANPAALALAGGDITPLAGLQFWDVGWVGRPQEQARVRQALERAAAGESVQLDIVRDHHGGEMWVAVSFKPVPGADGSVAWIVAEGRDLTEWRRREDALSQAVDALTRSNQELERFAHVAAHDLQEPCRTVVSYAQLLERRYAGPLGGEGREFLDYLVQGAHRMRDLVNDLLAYSHVSGKAAPFGVVDCREVVAGVIEDMRRTIVDAGADITVGDLPVVLGDGAQLGMVFQHLLGNALKFRRLDVVPRISVSAERKPGEWVIAVSDNGIGIASDYHDRVFDVFQRLHGTDRFPGTGIGLAICRRVVERHGGRIWVESQEGAGAILRFTLPSG